MLAHVHSDRRRGCIVTARKRAKWFVGEADAGINGVETTWECKRLSLRTRRERRVVVPAHATEWVPAVRTAAQDEGVLHPGVAVRVVQEMHGPSRATTDPLTDLSERDREVLHLMADRSATLITL